ncbi:MAG: hypothetical protein K2I75_07740 [Clostridiales bacterium]|nr:hypothetical protein [Clostridiales bacterium]
MCIKKRKAKKDLTIEQKDKRFKLSCCAVGISLVITLVIFLILDCGNVIQGKSLNSAIACVLTNHASGVDLFCYILYYFALYLAIAAYSISSAWIIAKKDEKRWIMLLLCNSVIFMTIMNVYASGFVHAGWQSVSEMYSTIVTTISTVVMATAVVAFGFVTKKESGNSESQKCTPTQISE